MTSKNQLRFNLVIVFLFFGIAAFLAIIFGVSQLLWYMYFGPLYVGVAFVVGSGLLAFGCVFAIMLFARKLKKKMETMVD